MNRKLIEALARAEAIRDHPTTPMVCRSVIAELCELLREMEADAEESEQLVAAWARAEVASEP